MDARMERKRPRDRPREKMLDGLIEDEHHSVIKRRALGRDKWKGWFSRICQ